MNIFVIHSGSDYDIVAKKIKGLRRSSYKLNALVLKNGNALWKIDAAKKIKKSQMVIFYVGENSHKSPYIAWELKKAMKYNKPIYTIKLDERFENHPALKLTDSYSGEEDFYSKNKTEEELLEIISKYESGDYNIFNNLPEETDKGILLEQYKSFLQTSEDLVSRRQNVNNFYISINSALIAVFSAMFAFELSAFYRMIIGVLFSLVGIILSVSWIKILVAYGNLNGSKMKIISGIEKQLPASLYDAEWAALSDRLNKKKYVSFTDNEKNIPKIFICIYAIVIIMLVFLFLTSTQ